jgi:hypothetical protein
LTPSGLVKAPMGLRERRIAPLTSAEQFRFDAQLAGVEMNIICRLLQM